MASKECENCSDEIQEIEGYYVCSACGAILCANCKEEAELNEVDMSCQVCGMDNSLEYTDDSIE